MHVNCCILALPGSFFARFIFLDNKIYKKVTSGLTCAEIDDQEIIELVPNIILNPGFEGDTAMHTEHIPADENCNSETVTRLNNNTVTQPRIIA